VPDRDRPFAGADDVALVLTELSGLLVHTDGVSETLQRIVDVAVTVIDGCDAAGVTITARGRPRTAAHTDHRTLAIDADQYRSGEGPCLEAAAAQEVRRVDVADAAGRWPDFTRVATADGVRSFLAAPLGVGGEPLGALNLYSRNEHAFGDLDEVFVGLLAGQASSAVANSLRYADAVALTLQLEGALESRVVIEQAKGVLIGTLGVDAERAFDLLRQGSQRANTKLRDVAAEVVAGAVAGRPPSIP
jgi:GAF domain-containing protein